LWQIARPVADFSAACCCSPFFFSNPVDVGQPDSSTRFSTGVILGSIWAITAVGSRSFALHRLDLPGRRSGFWFARQPGVAANIRSLCENGNALRAVVLCSDFHAWLGLGIWSRSPRFTLVFFIVFFNVYQGRQERSSTTVLDNGRMLGHERAGS